MKHMNEKYALMYRRTQLRVEHKETGVERGLGRVTHVRTNVLLPKIKPAPKTQRVNAGVYVSGMGHNIVWW